MKTLISVVALAITLFASTSAEAGLRTRVLPGSFQPTWVPPGGAPCVGWWDAGNGITASTGVSSWADQSTGGHALTQGTGSKQPTPNVRGGAGPNGYPYLAFVSANSQDLVSVSFTFSQPEYIVIVATFTSATAGVYLFDGHSSGASGGFERDTSTAVFYRSSTAVAVTGLTPQSWHAWEILFQSPNSAMTIDGTTVSSGATTGVLNMTGIVLGEEATGVNFADANISTVAIFSSAPTGTQLTQLRTWEQASFGL